SWFVKLQSQEAGGKNAVVETAVKLVRPLREWRWCVVTNLRHLLCYRTACRGISGARCRSNAAQRFIFRFGGVVLSGNAGRSTALANRDLLCGACRGRPGRLCLDCAVLDRSPLAVVEQTLEQAIALGVGQRRQAEQRTQQQSPRRCPAQQRK